MKNNIYNKIDDKLKSWKNQMCALSKLWKTFTAAATIQATSHRLIRKITVVKLDNLSQQEIIATR